MDETNFFYLEKMRRLIFHSSAGMVFDAAWVTI